MNKLNNGIILGPVLLTGVFLGLLILLTPVTTNVQASIENSGQKSEYENNINTNIQVSTPKSCKDSFLLKNEGGGISENVLSALNSYLSQNPVAVGDEPLRNVKNVNGLCVLIKLVETENVQGRQGNEEQIRNILNAALGETSSLSTKDYIIDSLLALDLIEPSDD